MIIINEKKFIVVTWGCEFVGSNFANKAREIYYNKYKNKNIYGVATKKEEEDLLDEGVEITSIPWVNKKDN